MQQSSRKSPWPHTAFPCQIRFTWLPGESCRAARLRAARQETGQGLQQGSVPLLAPFPCSALALWKMSEEEKEGPIHGRDGVLLKGSAELVGPRGLSASLEGP